MTRTQAMAYLKAKALQIDGITKVHRGRTSLDSPTADFPAVALVCAKDSSSSSRASEGLYQTTMPIEVWMIDKAPEEGEALELADAMSDQIKEAFLGRDDVDGQHPGFKVELLAENEKDVQSGGAFVMALVVINLIYPQKYC